MIVCLTVTAVSAHPGHGHYADEVTSDDVSQSTPSQTETHESESASDSVNELHSSQSHSKSGDESESSKQSTNSHSQTPGRSQTIETAQDNGDSTVRLNSTENMENNVSNDTNLTSEERDDENLLTPVNIFLLIGVFIIGFAGVMIFDKIK